ncbi:Binding-protein-dependent transport systems inner membrane component [uncultured spirochete]|jgi:peptide/nickel transport system permease protein|uniref:Binding-protein-dependent transport systems inner membrane component n=1 Tax=uncultured spirochete TaxID=156406 RepID=A0A3P3XLA3_9SPIR|nr:ABC transporter permease [Rectinema subterraneum]SLM15363.1 Binding-protein-dependent transport systems inner membrane component [uncultured spirochete]HIH36318.1 ABC transporter permease [Methanocellales archaeon]
MWKRFKKHKIALTGLVLLFLLIIPVVFAEFFAPYGLNETSSNSYAAPTRIRFTDEKGKFSLKPFVYDAQPSFDLNTGQTFWKEDTTSPHYLRLFIHGSAYSILGLKLDIHLFGAEGGHVFIMGTDALGRDVFSRLLYGGRVSLAIAFITALFALIAGSLAGIVSGFFGGVADMIIQRVIELFITIPNIPLGLALAAFLPPNLNPILLIAAISLVIALVMWANIARQVRGKTLPLRDAVHVQAAVALGASTPRVLLKHIFPAIYSHLIVVVTLAIPQAMLAEAGLSFLGFGVRPPLTSWGALLQDAQNFRTISLYPWVAVPGLAIAVTVLLLNFVGDGLRDATDPYLN